MNKYFTLKSLLSQHEEPAVPEEKGDNTIPSKNVIRNILNYSKALRVYSSRLGNLEFNMN